MRRAILVVSAEKQPRGVCFLEFGNDLSIYLRPYAKSSQYFFGEATLKVGEHTATFPFHTQFATTKAPRLSIHESGSVHIRSGHHRITPAQIAPLASLAGHYVASVTVDSFDQIPDFNPGNHKKPGDAVYVVPLPNATAGVRLLLYVNANTHTFHPSVTRVFQMTGSRTIYVGVAAEAINSLGTEKVTNGVTIISGWNPVLPPGSEQRLLFVRGA